LILATGGLADGAPVVDLPGGSSAGGSSVVVDGSAGGAARLRALRGRPTALGLNGSAAGGGDWGASSPFHWRELKQLQRRHLATFGGPLGLAGQRASLA
jgi:hypothetical protein